MPRGRYMTEAEKTEIWDRRGRGEPLYVIARQIGRSLEGVRLEVNLTGGVRPEPRRRPRGALSTGEREEISRGLASNHSYRAIGARIGRPHSTVWKLC
jgi:IS30 family transposase